MKCKIFCRKAVFVWDGNGFDDLSKGMPVICRKAVFRLKGLVLLGSGLCIAPFDVDFPDGLEGVSFSDKS